MAVYLPYGYTRLDSSQRLTIQKKTLHSNRMKVIPSKSTLTLTTRNADEYNLQRRITINSIPIPYTDTATTLGVTYDKKIRFTSHTDNISTKAKTLQMSSEHLPTQHSASANPKKPSPWCTNSTTGPYSHTPTQHGNQTQQQHT